MTKIGLEIHDNVITTLYKIRNINDDGIDLEIPEGSVLFENIINLKLIEKEADKLGMTVHFLTKDEAGNQMILMLDETGETADSTVLESDREIKDVGTEKSSFQNAKKYFRIKLSLPDFSISKSGLIKPTIIGIIIAGAVFGTSAYITRAQKAVATIKIASQPLVRSVTVKAGSSLETNTENITENITLRSTPLSTFLDGNKELETTGETTIGEKAAGEVKIYNNTDSDKKFKKGTELVYKDEYRYLITEDITVPEKIYSGTDPGDPSLSIYKKGEEIAGVVAYDIGDKYNLDEGKSLEIKGQKSSEFSAIISEEITGGKSEKVKAVSEEDLSNLKNTLLQEMSENTETVLLEKTGNGQVLIKGSSKITITSEKFDHATGDRADKLALSMALRADALSYASADLKNLMDNIVNDLVPEGFELSDKDTEIQTEVLGNSSKSVLSSTEADLQVTIKTYVIPKIDTDKLIKELKGKKIRDAEKVLGSLKNIKGYSLVINPRVPFLTKVPKNIDQIEIKIERE